MATKKQKLANQQNALKSTGPKTEEGKTAVRLNALTHGLTASGRLLPDEDADVVFGSRFLNGYNHMRWISGFANRVLTSMTNILYGTDLTDMEACYKVFRRELVPKLNLQGQRFDFEPEITAKFARMGLRIVELPVSYRPRHFLEGKTIGWSDGFDAVWTLLKYRVVRI